MDAQIGKTQLQVPQRSLNTLTFCSADAQSINQWLQALPRADLPDCASQLSAALRELAQLNLTANTLFSLVELVRPVVYVITDQISRSQLTDGILFSEEQQHYLTLNQQLYENLLLCYKAITDIYLKQNNSDASMAAPVHRSVSESLSLLLLMLEHYRSTPEKLWLEVHKLIHIAEQQQLQDCSLDDPQTSKSHDLTILDQYKRMLLLSHCRSNKLHQTEIRQVNKALCLWSHHGKLLSKIDHNCWFMVNTAADEGLYYALSQTIDDNPDLKGMDTRILSAHLKKVANSIDDDKPLALSKKLVQHLASAWSQPTQRQHSRHPSSKHCSVCYGSGATHYYLSNKQAFDDLVRQHTNTYKSGRSGFISKKNDVWDDAHDADQKGIQSISEKGSVQFEQISNDAPLYTYYTGTVVNTSASGYCLRLQAMPDAPVFPGKLIAIREGSRQQWILASIRWVHTSEQDTLLGAELLSANTTPCAITPLQKTRDTSHYQRSFLQSAIPALGNPPTLITPRIPFASGMKFMLVEGEEIRKGQLLECIEATPSYSQYQFRFLDNTL